MDIVILVIALMVVSFILGALWREEWLGEQEYGTFINGDIIRDSDTFDPIRDVSPLRKD